MSATGRAHFRRNVDTRVETRCGLAVSSRHRSRSPTGSEAAGAVPGRIDADAGSRDRHSHPMEVPCSARAPANCRTAVRCWPTGTTLRWRSSRSSTWLPWRWPGQRRCPGSGFAPLAPEAAVRGRSFHPYTQRQAEEPGTGPSRRGVAQDLELVIGQLQVLHRRRDMPPRQAWTCPPADLRPGTDGADGSSAGLLGTPGWPAPRRAWHGARGPASQNAGCARAVRAPCADAGRSPPGGWSRPRAEPWHLPPHTREEPHEQG